MSDTLKYSRISGVSSNTQSPSFSPYTTISNVEDISYRDSQNLLKLLELQTIHNVIAAGLVAKHIDLRQSYREQMRSIVTETDTTMKGLYDQLDSSDVMSGQFSDKIAELVGQEKDKYGRIFIS